MRAKRAKRVAILERLSKFFLLYLIFFTAYFSMMTLSKYIGKATGNGTAEVAKWEVYLDTEDNSSDTLSIISGNATQSYILKVTSTSEIATNYSVVLSNLPNEIEVKIDDATYQTPTNNKITFDNIGSFNANDENNEHTHTLTFNAPLDSNIVGESNISIDVTFVQVNPQ